jgi:hypothetical protein
MVRRVHTAGLLPHGIPDRLSAIADTVGRVVPSWLAYALIYSLNTEDTDIKILSLYLEIAMAFISILHIFNVLVE